MIGTNIILVKWRWRCRLIFRLCFRSAFKNSFLMRTSSFDQKTLRDAQFQWWVYIGWMFQKSLIITLKYSRSMLQISVKYKIYNLAAVCVCVWSLAGWNFEARTDTWHSLVIITYFCTYFEICNPDFYFHCRLTITNTTNTN